MSPQEIDEILERYLRNECTGKEKQLVEEWFDAIGKDDRELDIRTQAAVQKRLWSKLDNTEHKISGYWKLTRIAAALLFLGVSTFFLINYFHSEVNTVRASNGHVRMLQFMNPDAAPKRIAMKDGSVIMLQPGSEVSFPEIFRDTREVYLSGEAFFEVTRNINQPFLVYANEVTTKVLGTSFLVKAYKQDKEITVAVKTGKVSVFTTPSGNKHDTQDEIIVTPNQQVIYNRNENNTVKMLVDNPQVIVQQPPMKANFKNAPVVEIFQALEKNYGIRIQYDANALSGCTLTYADIAEEGLYEQIEIICNALGARYKRSEFSILIEAEGCK
ncbi:MAG TPA: FecR family protein [Chryseolinea sp.]|nr:FecR family protein [Chryseolinea sp.]